MTEKTFTKRSTTHDTRDHLRMEQDQLIQTNTISPLGVSLCTQTRLK